jgi:lipopolysaccharide transport system permease protein
MKTAPPLGYYVDVLQILVSRELRLRYKGSWLGLLWAVLSPLGTVLILTLLFTQFLPLDIPHYPAFLYSALLPWTWFQAAVQSGATTLIDNRDLVRKPFFFRPLLPAVVAATNFLLYLLALPVLLGLLLVEGVPPAPAWLLLPVVWVVEGLFVLACTVLFAALGALIRDVQHLLGLGLLLWFYLTPIFYDLERLTALQAQWLWLNPMTTVVMAHRSIVLSGELDYAGPLLALGAASLAVLGLCLLIFRSLEDSFVEVV